MVRPRPSGRTHARHTSDEYVALQDFSARKAVECFLVYMTVGLIEELADPNVGELKEPDLTVRILILALNPVAIEEILGVRYECKGNSLPVEVRLDRRHHNCIAPLLERISQLADLPEHGIDITRLAIEIVGNSTLVFGRR